MTAKELGKRLFEIHDHAVLYGGRLDSEQIIYKEEDIVKLLVELGHPEPDWDWWKDDSSFKTGIHHEAGSL